MILCMGLPITSTIASEYLNSSTLHDDINCITANGQKVIYVGGDKTCHMMIIVWLQTFVTQYFHKFR